MTDRFHVDPIAVSILAGALTCDFGYLLNRELAEAIALAAIKMVAEMQEYSGNKVWRMDA